MFVLCKAESMVELMLHQVFQERASKQHSLLVLDALLHRLANLDFSESKVF